ncbi:protease [Lithospermum erythrorhizon]|uniref:Protease n=1 Tax=Lithospermum erythrorhizon TaxID=34254 RepID=A0AAV3QEI6_LITER
MKTSANEKILSYNDVVLRRSDLDILSGPYFLNDRIIEFYFSYLATCYPSEDVLLIPPGITFWIKECPDITSLKDFLDPLQFSKRKLILFPVNDNDDVNEAGGGSHWSLLTFERDSNAFVHHDSSSLNMNRTPAKRICKAVLPYTAEKATFLECSSTPKQTNGYDCGLYVSAIARVICKWHEKGGNRDTRNLWFADLDQITPSVVSQLRNEILELIKNMMAAQGKS